MENWIQEAISKWQTDKVKLNPETTISAIENAEAALDFKLPDDFKRLYLAVDGFKDYDWQEHLFSFWSLKRVINEYNEEFIGFCDFLIMSHVIGFKKNDPGIFKIYPSLKDEPMEKIANTFEEIVSMINNNNRTIY